MPLDSAAALLPVVGFLGALLLMDSFKLVPLRVVCLAIVAGGVAAMACIGAHGWLLDVTSLSDRAFARYVAPLTEESAKGLFVLAALWRRRIGFLVDAAVIGFAVGTGFALVENVDYLRALGDAPALLWITRGVGTAVLHGGTTGLLAMVAKGLADRYPRHHVAAALPALGVAVAVHSAFNHFLVSPLASALLLLVVLPVLVVVVFERSERATREWVGEGLDLDVELLGLVTSSIFPETRLGAYLRQLKARFPGPVVADMFCLLRLEIELSIRAKGMLMAREAGLEVPVDADLRARLEELRYLRRSIGPTGLLALKPLEVTSHRDEWHRYLLEQAGGGSGSRVWATLRAWSRSRRG